MLTQLLPIARNSFLESVRQPVVLLLILLCGFLLILTTWNTGYSMGYGSLESSEIKADDKLLFDIGLATIFVVGVILAGFVATAVLSREIENKTVLTIISKPVSRVSVVVGKYLGVVATLTISCGVMILFLLLALRHGVMSTAADDLDGPVLVLAGGALLLGMGLAAWGNYFYGWNFCQTATLLLFPLFALAYLGVLLLTKRWTLQPIGTNFLPQVATASCFLLLAILVLSAVATAASTRLGQVMTIVTCLGVFLAALLSNYFLGRHVFQNQAVGIVESATLPDPTRSFEQDQSPLVIRFTQPLQRGLPVGTPIYYGPSPNGFPLMVHGTYAPTPIDSLNVDDVNELVGSRAKGPAIIAVKARDQELTIRNIGPKPVVVDRPPEKGDYVFARATKINVPLLAVWGMVPNFQFFWLIDAVSQNRPLPLGYVTLGAGYALMQIVAFLSLAVVLFQKRDVG
jgi:ABC-2 type transport system permease protein